LEDDHPLAATGVPQTARHGEAGGRSERCHSAGLIVAELEDRTATGAQEAPEIPQQPADRVEPVGSAIEG
jgi:hypothetical protein